MLRRLQDLISSHPPMTTTDEFDITQYLSRDNEDVEGSSPQGNQKTLCFSLFFFFCPFVCFLITCYQVYQKLMTKSLAHTHNKHKNTHQANNLPLPNKHIAVVQSLVPLVNSWHSDVDRQRSGIDIRRRRVDCPYSGRATPWRRLSTRRCWPWWRSTRACWQSTRERRLKHSPTHPPITLTHTHTHKLDSS